jgi:hypothetical protein
MTTRYSDVEKRISEACIAYGCREKPKIATLAREFDVPYQRLRGRIQGKNSRSTRPTTNKALDDAQEQALVQ